MTNRIYDIQLFHIIYELMVASMFYFNKMKLHKSSLFWSDGRVGMKLNRISVTIKNYVVLVFVSREDFASKKTIFF